jgi:hypothetical protein
MCRTAIRTGMGLVLLLCIPIVGCVTSGTPGTPAPFTPEPMNPFVEQILKQETLVFKKDGVEVKVEPPRVAPDVVLREVPLQTSVTDARAVMERHGFSCQAGTREDYRECLYCTAYKRKSHTVADRVVVRFFYEKKRVYDVVVTVERDVKRSNTLFPEF